MVCAGSILAGYLIGSFVPGYFIGKLKGVDIRETGRKYAGTLNVYHVLGFWPAVPTAVVDILKGIAAMLFAERMGAGFVCVQLSGFAAVVGHVLPFYIKFRGGQGVACATGILLLYLRQYTIAGGIGLDTLGFLFVLVVIFFYVSRTGEVVGLMVLPSLCYALILNQPKSPYNPYLLALAFYIIGVGIHNIKTRKLLKIEDDTFRSHWWRLAFRPGALIFVLFYLKYTRIATLKLIGLVSLFFLLIDFIRIVNRRTEKLFTDRIKYIFKKGEKRSFSSMTMFLLAAFFSVLFFSKDIAVSTLTFLIFGDMFSKIFGMAFGRHKLFNKSLEGTLAYIGGALICAFVLYKTLYISISLLVVGSITAAVAEALPLKIDDNFTVGLFTGVAMSIAKGFGV